MKEIGDGRTALDKEAIKRSFLDDLFYMQGKFPALATQNDYYMALAYAVRDRMLQRWISTAATYTRAGEAGGIEEMPVRAVLRQRRVPVEVLWTP